MSLRERLAQRARATATFDLRIDDDTDAQVELAEALDGDDPDRLAAARAAVQDCYETLHITALPPADWEALVAAHPPADGHERLWNIDTFGPALLAASIDDSDITEQEWAEYTTKGALTTGEVHALYDAVLTLNYRVPDTSAVGKGSIASQR